MLPFLPEGITKKESSRAQDLASMAMVSTITPPIYFGPNRGRLCGTAYLPE